MMRLTAIRPRRKKLSLLVIDGEEAMTVDTGVLQEMGYREGSELDDEQLKELLDRSQKRRAREKALYLLEYRNHSRKELEDKISRVTSREAAREAACHMQELGLVDDTAYACDCARELVYRKGFARSRARWELEKKGIDRETAEYALDELHADWEEILGDVVERKYSRQLTDDTGKRRTIQALMRRGYRYEEIRPVLLRWAPMDDE